ncbi:hypothetical protein CBS63078_9848 [Aspergillus niger]|nr:hypothetical protein CBS115989_9346 [Aspergillus niger]RDH17179.1 hypothetical protein M747DRAFT_298133 [Aspergillus niger ATCC 13496]KAI2814281.1 hypothetical protein CBS133816_10959 [Aspergillus niger]KAI2843612.1 hypothetical protein CBS11350_5101 [Aspergillus niger]KAI2847827.1 hypothetical protein CBS11232_7023 [Aspergillus niger]
MADSSSPGNPTLGNRRNNRAEEEAASAAAAVLPNEGMKAPGVTANQDEKSNLKISIHLNLRAKVKLDLDAQLYGDIVIGLL